MPQRSWLTKACKNMQADERAVGKAAAAILAARSRDDDTLRAEVGRKLGRPVGIGTWRAAMDALIEGDR